MIQKSLVYSIFFAPAIACITNAFGVPYEVVLCLAKSETGRWAPPFDEDQPCQRSTGKHDTVISSSWSECIHSALKLMTVLQKWRISSRGLNLTPPHLPPKKNKQPTWMVIFGHLFATSLMAVHQHPRPQLLHPKSLGLQGLDAAAFVENSHWIDGGMFRWEIHKSVQFRRWKMLLRRCTSNYIVGSYQIYK